MQMKGQVHEVQGTCSFHLCLSGPGEIFMGGKGEILPFAAAASCPHGAERAGSVSSPCWSVWGSTGVNCRKL